MKMENNDGAYQPNRKRTRNQEDSSSSSKRFHQGGDEPLLKLLVPVYAVGALIGKKGSILADLRTKYGGNIRISPGKEYYPGTEERIIVLTGTTDEILAFNQHIMEKVEDPGRDGTMRRIEIDDHRSQKVKIVLTNLAAGLLIGKGGNTIKNIQTNTRAKISIAAINEGPVPGERVLTMSGSLDDRIEACKHVVEVIAKDTSNMGNTTLKYSGLHVDNRFQPHLNLPNNGSNNDRERGSRMNDFGPSLRDGSRFNTLPSIKTENAMDRSSLERALMDSIAEKLSAFTNSANIPHNNPPSFHNTGGVLKTKVEMTVEVPQGLVGSLLGKQGSIIKEMARNSGGAKFNFADIADNDTNGTRNLRITGDVDQVYKAYNLVNDRVEEVLKDNQRQQPPLREGKIDGRLRPRSRSPRRDGTAGEYRWNLGSLKEESGRGGRSDFGMQGFLNSY